MDLGRIEATIAVTDLDAARAFYGGTLGLRATDDQSWGISYELAGTRLFVYPSGFAGTNQATSAAFEVPDLEAVVDELAGRGVVFLQYDLPGLKTDERGIADIEGERTAWFKDPDGNILAVGVRT